jgi:hypothetical protein
MRAFRIGVAALAATLFVSGGAHSAPPGAHAAPASGARKAIQAAFDRDTVAFRKLDLDEVLSNCAPNFVSTDKDGTKIGYAVMRQRLQQLKQVVKAMTYRARIDSFKSTSSAVALTVSEHLVIIPMDRKLTKITWDSVSEETWAVRGNRWLRETSKTISEKVSPPQKRRAAPKRAPIAPSGGTSAQH